METQPLSPRLWLGRALIILFVLFLLLPFMDTAYQLDPTSTVGENRLLTPFPDPPAGVGGLQKYFSGLEAYFNDHFGWRLALVRWHDELALWLFKEDSHDVLVGNNDWLYYSSARMIDHYRGDIQFTGAELQSWQNLIERRRDWLAQRGIKYLFVLAPDKQSVYPEYLPAWLKKTGRPTKADQFIAYMKAHSTVEILDLRPALLAAKKTAPVFQQTDTHWNQLGAYIAYADMVDALAKDELPGLKPIPLDAFKRTSRLSQNGDLSRVMGISLIESNTVFFRARPGLPVLEMSSGPISMTVGGIASTRQRGGHGVAIVYHDSFGFFWVPFLGYQFGEVDYFWQSQLDPKIIEQKQPVVVIDEMLERLFDTTDPVKLSVEDALP
jgi:alginate O-acetyltransferase complex protein AlgJ